MTEEEIIEALKLFPGSRRAANGVIIGDEKTGFMYIQDFGRKDDEFSDDERFYLPFCSKSEIFRLRNIKTPHDYLLRIRANAIVDSSRITRVMSTRRRDFERRNIPWSLTRFYEKFNVVPKRYISRLPRRERKIIRAMPFGFAPIMEANALCMRTVVGEIIVISEMIRYAFYFITICIYGESFGVDYSDRADAGIMALRIIIGSESQDFDIDPRCYIDKKIENSINDNVDNMMEFVFGHECGHLILKHNHGDASVQAGTEAVEYKTFSQNHEYAADLFAVNILSNDKRSCSKMASAGYNVFLYLHLLELMSEDFSVLPKMSVSNTHPSPLERLRHLRENISLKGQPDQTQLGLSINAVRQVRDLLLARIQNADDEHLLTRYGSIYLYGLGGRERRDRIDY